MKTLIVAALVLAVLGGAWWLVRSQHPEVPADPARDPPPTDRSTDRNPAVPPAAAVNPDADEPAFRDRLRDFIARASELSEEEREAEAAKLRRDTLAREAEGALVPAESAYIQLALLRATLTDEALLQRRSEALLEQYETASRQGWEEYRRRADPRHQAYREAEAELIRRARDEGVAEQELRERLQALREQHYE